MIESSNVDDAVMQVLELVLTGVERMERVT